MSVYQSFRNRNPIEGTLFGVELEIEDVSEDDTEDASMLRHARVIQDGSLRNGIEIVTNVLNRTQLVDFASLYQAWASNHAVSLSERCSTHIHVNVQDMEYEQLRSFLWLCIAVEGVLLEYCSNQRRSNTYCYPSYKVTNTVSWYRELLSRSKDNDNVLGFLQRGSPKYTAIGLFRLADYGTVEFRMFDGTTTADHIIGWADMISSLRSLAMTNTVEQLRDQKLRDGVLSLLTTAITAHRGDIPDDRLSIILNRGIEMANDIVRPALSASQILTMHATLFPNKAPITIERGVFGSTLLNKLCTEGRAPMEAHVRMFNRQLFEEAYGNSNPLYALFNELSYHTVEAADIVVTVRSVYY